MKKTSDILFAAWLDVEKNIEFKSYEKKHSNIFFFYFDVDDHNWDEYKKEFHGSTTTKCRYAVKRIKDLLS